MLKIGQRVKNRDYRGTVLSALREPTGIWRYSVALEVNKGIVYVKGSDKQFSPAYNRRARLTRNMIPWIIALLATRQEPSLLWIGIRDHLYTMV